MNKKILFNITWVIVSTVILAVIEYSLWDFYSINLIVSFLVFFVPMMSMFSNLFNIFLAKRKIQITSAPVQGNDIIETNIGKDIKNPVLRLTVNLFGDLIINVLFVASLIFSIGISFFFAYYYIKIITALVGRFMV